MVRSISLLKYDAERNRKDYFLGAEAHITAVKQQEDGMKAQDAPEGAAAEDNDELDIQLDEDVSLQLSACCSTH